jgi:MFS family permease
MRRSWVVLAVVVANAAGWGLVILWPGQAPLSVLVLLIVALGLGGPGSMVGFDLARTFNPPSRLGTATGMVNVGGFFASLVTILLVGMILDIRTGGSADYDIGDFKVAMSVQFLIMAIGITGILRTRRLARGRLAEEGITVRPIREVLAEKRWFSYPATGKGNGLTQPAADNRSDSTSERESRLTEQRRT